MAKSKSKSQFKSKSNSKNNIVKNQNRDDIVKLRDWVKLLLNPNSLEEGLKHDLNMLSKLSYQLERLAKYEDRMQNLVEQNQVMNNQALSKDEKLKQLTEENNALKSQLNEYKNAIANIATALQSKKLELLESEDYSSYDSVAIKECFELLKRFVDNAKTATKSLMDARAKSLGIGNSSEKNTGKAKSSSAPKDNDNDNDQDKGLSFSSQKQIDEQNEKDIEEICQNGALINTYLLDQAPYLTKYNEQLSSVSNQEQIKALSSLVSSKESHTEQQIYDVLLGVLDYLPEIVVGKAHTDGDQYEQIEVSISEQADKHVNEIKGIRHRLSTVAKTTSLVCPKCNQHHEFSIGHVVYEQVINTPSGTKIIKVLEPVYHLTSNVDSCDYAFNCPLNFLDVQKSLLEEFDISNEKIKEILDNEALSYEEKSREFQKLVLEKDNSLNNPANGNLKTTDVKQYTRKYKEAKNVPHVYDSEEHKNSLQESLKLKAANEQSSLAQIDDINNAARKIKAREIECCADIANVSGKFDFVMNDKGITCIDPNNFNYEVNAVMPLYRSVTLSSEMLALGAVFKTVYAPTNAIHKLFDNTYIDSGLCSRQTFNNHINALGRVLHGVNMQSKNDILANSKSVLIDETIGKVRSGPNKSIKTKYIWALRTGKTEPQQECCFQAMPDRSVNSAKAFLEDFVPIIDSGNSIVAKTDAFVDYFKIFAICDPNKIKHSTCITHGRRPFHTYLKNSNLLKIYNETLLPKGTDFSQFSSNLSKYLKDNPKSISIIDLAILIAYYIMNAIFAVDGSVNDRHNDYSTDLYKQELQEVRDKYSVKLLYVLNKLQELLANKFDMICFNEKSKRYNINKAWHSKEQAKGVIYWMNSRNSLSNFIDSADIELSQSGVERAIRPLAIGRRVSFWMDTQEGLAAYADINNVIANCIYADVNIQSYLVWVQANIKHRALNLVKDPEFVAQFQEQMKERAGTAYYLKDEVLKLPSRSEIYVNCQDDDGIEFVDKQYVGIYDPRNTSCAWLDAISYEGLTPKDYKALLAQKK